MTIFLEDKIKNIKLTNTEKKIAEYIIKNTFSVCFSTLNQISKILEVSDTSIIRFTRKLNYDGFNDLQKDLRKNIIESVDFNNILTPVEKLSNVKRIQEENIISKTFDEIVNNMSASIEKNSEEKINKVVDILLKSKRKYIVGFRGCKSLAEFFSLILGHTIKNVSKCTEADASSVEKIIDIENEDCVLIFSFPRYAKMAMICADIAKQNNAKVITITDKITSPFYSYSDIIIPVETNSFSFFNSYTSAMFISEVILNLINKKVNGKNEDRLELLDYYIKQDGLY